jgi:hypothetical protein
MLNKTVKVIIDEKYIKAWQELVDTLADLLSIPVP